MPASEIDDIFAGVASTSSASVAKAPTKKQKKRKAEVVESGSSSSKSNSTPSSSLVTGKSKSDKPKKTQSGKAAAETVLDPSKIIEAKVQAKKLKPSSSKSKLTEEEADFMDTRGKSRRRTEDGFLIYKADELKIDEESGGTPLCPFDCDCCH